MKKENIKLYWFLIFAFLTVFLIPITYSKYTSSFNKKVSISLVNPQYTVAFNSNAPVGTTPVGAMTNQAFTYGTADELNENKFSVKNYIFTGWNTSVDGTGASYDDQQSVINLSYVDGDVVTLYAQWRVLKVANVTMSGEGLLGKMKQFANNGIAFSSPYAAFNTNIVSFKRASTSQYNAVKGSLTSDNVISSSSSTYEVNMWFDDTEGTIYFYTDADIIGKSGDMIRMFAKMTNLTDISGLEYFDTSAVTDINRMLQDCPNLSDLSPLADWDVSSVTNMAFMFGANPPREMSISDLTPLKNWNVSNVTNMDSIFKYCKSLTTLTGLENWNVSNVTNFQQAFNQTGLTDAMAIKDWNVIKATNFDKMLGNTSSTLPADKMPSFTVKPGTWNSQGTYIPN